MANEIPNTDVFGRIMEDSSVAEQIWMFREEFRALQAVQRGFLIERVHDFAGPQDLFNEHFARYTFASEYARNKRVLDLACGTGYGSHHLLTHGGAQTVVGADVDRTALRYAQIRYRDDDCLHFVQADACEGLEGEAFDTIVSFETIEHVPQPDRMLESMVRMLRADGVFIVSTPIRISQSLRDRPINPFHIREWSFEEFQDLLKLYFGHVQMFGQRWLLREPHIGPVRLPGRFRPRYLKWHGYTFTILDDLRYKVRDPNTLTNPSMLVGPSYSVAVCREPHAVVNHPLVKKLCYGD